jgi:hypothetical protein
MQNQAAWSTTLTVVLNGAARTRAHKHDCGSEILKVQEQLGRQ